MNMHIRGQLQSFNVLKASQVVGDNVLLAGNVIDFGGESPFDSKIDSSNFNCVVYRFSAEASAYPIRVVAILSYGDHSTDLSMWIPFEIST